MLFPDKKKAFEEFTRLMNEEKVYLDQSVTYRDICRRIGISPADLDEVLMDELGEDGTSLLDGYRRH